MSEVGLQYKGRQLYTDPDFQIDWQVEDDLLDFSQLGQAYSWTIQVPIKGNEFVFGYASDPANSRNRFKTYDGFAITMDGNIWWSCSFKLNAISDDRAYYEGVLTTIESEVERNLNRNIRSIITDTISISNGNWATAIGSHNTLSSPMVFPIMYFNPVLSLSAWANADLGADFEVAIPCFKLYYIMKKALEALGYTLIDEFSRGDGYRDRLILLNNKVLYNDNIEGTADNFDFTTIGNKVRVSDHLPDWTLKDLINEFIFYFGAKPYVNIEDKKLIFRSYKSSDKSHNVEIDHGEPGIPSQSDYNNISLEYTLSDEIEPLTGFPLEGNDRGQVNNLSAFNGLSGLSVGDYAFLKNEFAYYKRVKTSGGQEYSRLYALPYDKRATGADNVLELKSKCSPAIKSYFRQISDAKEGSYIVSDNGSGKVRIDLSSPVPFWNGRWVKLKLDADDEGKYPEDHLILVTADSGSNIDLDWNYDGTAVITSLLFFDDTDTWMPVFNEGMDYIRMIEDYGQSAEKFGNTSFQPRISLWWPGTEKIGSSDTYGYAGPDPYGDDPTTPQAEISLGLDASSTYNLYSRVYKSLFEVLAETLIVKLFAFMSTVDIKRLTDKLKFGKHTKGIIRFKSFRCTLTRNGIRNQEVEGYRL